jgi:hypothetical protein
MPYCSLADIHEESDVEQKFLWPLLTSLLPEGLGYAPSDLRTKSTIRFLVIDKGESQKRHRPDYIVLIAGLPVLVIEAKHPDETLDKALREARLYAAEINSLYKHGFNPCVRVLVSNAKETLSAPSDTAEVDFSIKFDDVNSASITMQSMQDLLGRSAMQKVADGLRATFKQHDFVRPLTLVGGTTVRNEEVGFNNFGVNLSLDFMHLFNPQTPKDRAHIVKNAYVRSRRREHFTDEIERIVRNAMPVPAGSGQIIEDTSNPSELLRALKRGKELQNRLFLLVGSVGSGKSTFVDYFREAKLTPEIREATVWISVNLNDAPVDPQTLEAWIVDEIITGLKGTSPETDFDSLETLKRVFAVEVNTLAKGPLAALPADSPRRDELLAEELLRLTRDRVTTAKCLARYLCATRNKLLVLVLDNCDKGDLAEQLQVFQIVRWIQGWLVCLRFLPIRDVTFDMYEKKPPLDTVIKDFVFRIEAPSFARVLKQRILGPSGFIVGRG